MCIDVFPWLNKDSFFTSMDEIAEQKKIAIRQKFKDMVMMNLQKRREKVGETNGGSGQNTVAQEQEVANG